MNPLTIGALKRAIQFDVIPSRDFQALETHVASLQINAAAQVSKNQSKIVLDDLRKHLADHILRRLYEPAHREFQENLRTLLIHTRSHHPEGEAAFRALRELAYRLPPEYLRETPTSGT